MLSSLEHPHTESHNQPSAPPMPLSSFPPTNNSATTVPMEVSTAAIGPPVSSLPNIARVGVNAIHHRRPEPKLSLKKRVAILRLSLKDRFQERAEAVQIALRGISERFHRAYGSAMENFNLSPADTAVPARKHNFSALHVQKHLIKSLQECNDENQFNPRVALNEFVRLHSKYFPRTSSGASFEIDFDNPQIDVPTSFSTLVSFNSVRLSMSGLPSSAISSTATAMCVHVHVCMYVHVHVCMYVYM